MPEFHELRSTLKRTVEPAIEPVSVSLFKLHARLGDCADEDLIYERYLKHGRSMVETDLQRALITQTWQLQMDRFPCWEIEARICPLMSVTGIVYVAADGTSTTIPASDYIVNTASEPGRIVPSYGKTWPVARCQENAVTVTFTAGYGPTAATVPEIACQAIRLVAAEDVISREAVGTLVDAALHNYTLLIDRLRWAGYR